jgi:hypothetical protein
MVEKDNCGNWPEGELGGEGVSQGCCGKRPYRDLGLTGEGVSQGRCGKRPYRDLGANLNYGPVSTAR